MSFNFDFLPAKTRELLFELAQQQFMDQFTLVGGTALALQIEHRQSEDLDFVYDGEVFDDNRIRGFIDKTFTTAYQLVKQDRGSQLDFIIRGVKVTFFTTQAVMVHFKVKDYSNPFKNLNIGVPRVIAVLKMVAIGQRNILRDYYDLYCLSKYSLKLNEIIALTQRLVPTLAKITYSETLIYVDDLKEDTISNHLKAKEKVTKKEIAEFFTEQLRLIHG